MSESDWLSEQDSFDLLKRMFPMGLRSDDLLTALCPEGWRSSSLKLLESSTATEEETEIDEIGYLRRSVLKCYRRGIRAAKSNKNAPYISVPAPVRFGSAKGTTRFHSLVQTGS